MGNEGMEGAIQYINRDQVLNLIKDFGEQREKYNKCSPALTASQIATMINGLKTKAAGFISFGEIRTTFTGLNMCMGTCCTCGKKLIWYAKEPITGCPYCFTRWKKEVKRNAPNHDALRGMRKGAEQQLLQSETGTAGQLEDEEE